MNRSQKANHYGTLAERKVAPRYSLELARSSWKDADRPDGRPVDIKATMYEHSDGQKGNFKLYERFHRKLRRRDGFYVFVVYVPRGSGIEIKRTKMIHSSQIPRLNWHGGGSHRQTQQAKLYISEIFG